MSIPKLSNPVPKQDNRSLSPNNPCRSLSFTKTIDPSTLAKMTDPCHRALLSILHPSPSTPLLTAFITFQQKLPFPPLFNETTDPSMRIKTADPSPSMFSCYPSNFLTEPYVPCSFLSYSAEPYHIPHLISSKQLWP